MKTRLFLRNKTIFVNKKRVFAAIFILAVFVFFALFLTNASFKEKTKNISFLILRLGVEPVHDLENFVKKMRLGFTGKIKLDEENSLLKKEIETLKIENEAAKIAIQRLKDIEINFGRFAFYAKRPLLANVVFRPPQIFFDSLILDIGENQGVKKEMKAVAFGHIFIGRISKVSPDSSEVLLLSDFNREENAILEKSKTAIILKGKGNYEMEIELPSSFKVEIGEMAHTLSPKPYLIALVQKIESETVSPLQKIILKFPFNFQNLQSVFLVD